MAYEHLQGLEFDIEKRNCYHLVRDFYAERFDIQLPDIACPTNWWAHGLDLYTTFAHRNGFEVIHDHPRDWKEGDIIVCALESTVGNHLAIVLDNGNILHHLVGQRSRITQYGGIFRNTTVGVYRHRSVSSVSSSPTIAFKDLDLPPHVRRQLEKAQRLIEEDAPGRP